MSVYVDTMRAPYGRMIMCHMIADTQKELFLMVNKIGVDVKWVQDQGTYSEHFDISLGKKKLALQEGAIEVSRKELVRKILKRKHQPSAAYLL